MSFQTALPFILAYRCSSIKNLMIFLSSAGLNFLRLKQKFTDDFIQIYGKQIQRRLNTCYTHTQTRKQIKNTINLHHLYN